MTSAYAPPHQIYSSYILTDRIDSIGDLEGKFVEAVIGYLFIVNLLPLIIVVIMWYESPKIAEILNSWAEFEVFATIIKAQGTPENANLSSFADTLRENRRKSVGNRVASEGKSNQHVPSNSICGLGASHPLRH